MSARQTKESGVANKPIVRIESPTAGHPTLEHQRAINDIANAAIAGMTNYIPVLPSYHKCADIAMGRNMILESNLIRERPWDFWLWFDDDEVCTPKDIAFLVDDMERHPELMMVGAPVAKAVESEYNMPVVYNKFDRALSMWGVWLTGWEERKLYMEPEYPMWYGTGFTLIRRAVFERIGKPWYYAVFNPKDRTLWHGHDLEFCDRVKQAGMIIGLDTRPKVGHRQPKYVNVIDDFLLNGNQSRAMTDVMSRSHIEASDKKDINTKDFWDDAWTQAGEDAWTEKRYSVLNEVAARIPVGAKVLQFGCGQGYFLVELKKAIPDLEIEGIDVSEVAVTRALNRGATARVEPLSNFSPNGDIGLYDVVLVIDWLERLPDPHKVFKRLVQCLKPEGQIIVVSADCTEAMGEHHHVISKGNLSVFLRDIGGREVELKPFEESITGPDGKPLAYVNRLFARAVFKEKEDVGQLR